MTHFNDNSFSLKPFLFIILGIVHSSDMLVESLKLSKEIKTKKEDSVFREHLIKNSRNKMSNHNNNIA